MIFCRILEGLTKMTIYGYIVLIKQYLIIIKIMTLLDNYFNVIEASRRLKVHPETVKRLCRHGDVPAIKIHNTWLISRDILENFAGTYTNRRGARRRLIK